MYKVRFLVQVCELMRPWQLKIALLCGRVSRVEVLALRCCGYRVHAISQAGHLQIVEYAPGQALWPGLALLKAHLRRCGVRHVLMRLPESHDEIIGRPLLLDADPGLWLRLV